MGLTKGLHFCAVIINPLLLEVVDKKDIVFGYILKFGESVIFAYDCVQKRRLSGTGIAGNQNI